MYLYTMSWWLVSPEPPSGRMEPPTFHLRHTPMRVVVTMQSWTAVSSPPLPPSPRRRSTTNPLWGIWGCSSTMEVQRRRGGITILKSGQEWTLPARLEQLKTGQGRTVVLLSHLCCPDDLPRLRDRIEKNRNTLKILKIGTPEIITIIVLQLEQLDFTVQYCVQKMQTE